MNNAGAPEMRSGAATRARAAHVAAAPLPPHSMTTPFPPGPRDRFFGLSILRDMAGAYLDFWPRMQRTYGDAVHFRVAGVHQFAFFHPDQIREVLAEKADSFIRYERHIDILRHLHGDSVITTEGDTWQRQRRALLPGFSPKRFDGYARAMVGAAGPALDALAGAAAAPVDFEQAMNSLTMDIILATMFTDASADGAAVATAVRVASEIAFGEMFYPFSLPDWLPLPVKARKRQAAAVIDGVIAHQLARRAPGQTHDDLLGMLMALGIPAKEVRDQLMTTFLAGHETTASGLTWAGWLLAAHPEVTARAQAEVDTVLAGRTPSAADVAALPYLGQVVKEVLRMYSPAPGVFTRRATEDVTIGGWHVPRGSLVAILSIVPHADPRWFPEPDTFDPDRFADARARALPRGAWIPFGTGPRVCLGNNFALLEMTLVLAMLLQRFDLSPAPGQQRPARAVQVTLRPAGGVRLCLRPRTTAATSVTAVRADVAAGCPFHPA
jgi:cytochrome P450